MFKNIVLKNIDLAQKRRDACIKKTPDDISSIRFWDGYVAGLNTLVAVLPEESDQQDIEDEWWKAIK